MLSVTTAIAIFESGSRDSKLTSGVPTTQVATLGSTSGARRPAARALPTEPTSTVPPASSVLSQMAVGRLLYTRVDTATLAALRQASNWAPIPLATESRMADFGVTISASDIVTSPPTPEPRDTSGCKTFFGNGMCADSRSGDEDADGFQTPTDCNDHNPRVHPDAVEIIRESSRHARVEWDVRGPAHLHAHVRG